MQVGEGGGVPFTGWKWNWDSHPRTQNPDTLIWDTSIPSDRLTQITWEAKVTDLRTTPKRRDIWVGT